MNPSSVLLALEEQKKWRERRKRVRERIHQLERRRATLREELEGVRKKILEYNRLLTDLKEARHVRPAASPIPPGR